VAQEDDVTLMTVSGLAKSFGGVHAIAGIDLDFQPGAIHSVIGPNGAGKTSLINMLSGVYRPDAGSIRPGRAGTGRPAGPPLRRGRHRPHLPEPAGVLQHDGARERHDRPPPARALLARLGAAAHPRAAARRGRIAQRRARAAAAGGLAGHEDASAEAMPYGALKRLEIARALAAQPAPAASWTNLPPA
jgi:branched-chain amino acid transport system ATP-binding protein